jgi:hypothetical protein
MLVERKYEKFKPLDLKLHIPCKESHSSTQFDDFSFLSLKLIEQNRGVVHVMKNEIFKNKIDDVCSDFLVNCSPLLTLTHTVPFTFLCLLSHCCNELSLHKHHYSDLKKCLSLARYTRHSTDERESFGSSCFFFRSFAEFLKLTKVKSAFLFSR